MRQASQPNAARASFRFSPISGCSVEAAALVVGLGQCPVSRPEILPNATKYAQFACDMVGLIWTGRSSAFKIRLCDVFQVPE